jgi:hypothetical protein
VVLFLEAVRGLICKGRERPWEFKIGTDIVLDSVGERVEALIMPKQAVRA